MPTISCPTCQMRLSLPDEMIGNDVRCPRCSSIFKGRASETIPVLEEAQPLDFSGAEPAVDHRRVRAIIVPALFWLRFSGVLFGISAGLGGLRILLELDSANAIYLSGSISGAAAMGFGCAAAFGTVADLQHLRRRGRIISNGIGLLVFAGIYLVLAFLFLGGSGGGRDDEGAILVLGGFLMAGFGVIHLVSGIKTLVVINQEEVTDAFR